MWADLAAAGEAPGCVPQINAALWPPATLGPPPEGALTLTLRVIDDV